MSHRASSIFHARRRPGRLPAAGALANVTRPTAAGAVAKPRGAFTLTELLIVMALIVLIIVLALPAFTALTGSRSTEAASNQLAALTGRARNEALGLQQVSGVMFFIDPGTLRVNGALVQEVPVANAPAGTVYLDLVPNRDALALPVGVGLQTIDNSVVASGIRVDDGYIGFNRISENGTAPAGPIPFTPVGGVILFDSGGRLTARNWRLLLIQNGQPTGMARLLWRPGNPPTSIPAHVSVMGATGASSSTTSRSAFGFVLFDQEQFTQFVARQNGDANGDPRTSYPADGPEKAEETWLDGNGLPFLINRYNGTLIRGE